MILWLVMECLVAFLVGYAMATYGAGCRFVVLFSLFSLLLAYCFDPYVFSYFREDQAWLIVSNAGGPVLHRGLAVLHSGGRPGNFS